LRLGESLAQHADERRPDGSILLAADQKLGEGCGQSRSPL
jgi:hypothetical protein